MFSSLFIHNSDFTELPTGKKKGYSKDMSLQEPFWHLDVHCHIINLHASFIYVFNFKKNVHLFPIYGTTQSSLTAYWALWVWKNEIGLHSGAFICQKWMENHSYWPDSQNAPIHIQCNVFNEKTPQLRNKIVVSP